MCWFEDSVIADAPRPAAPKPVAPAAPVAKPVVKETPLLPASPAPSPLLVPTESKEVQALVESEPVVETVEESSPPQLASQPVEEEEVTNLEHYSIHTEIGQTLGLTSYLNSAGVRMVEIHADSGMQIKLSSLEHCVKTMVESAARVDETEELERERQQEFDSCADVTVGAALVLLISFVVSIYIYLVSRGATAIY
jgi:hypothetical protein